jgi:hypothetical protein
LYKKKGTAMHSS